MTETAAAERDRWFSLTLLEASTPRANRTYSTHALLLEADIRLAFQAGAWLSVITMCVAAIEAQFRQVFREDYESHAFALFGSDPELTWLRTIRNEIVHAAVPGTASQLWKEGGKDLRGVQASLEPDAKRAVRIMFRANYARPPA